MEENKTKKLRAGFFFLSLGVVISLITTIVSGLSLFFKVIDKALPDVLNNNYYNDFYNYGDLAVLIIFFPILLILNHFWQKIIQKVLSSSESIFLKWTSYLILFLASLTIIIDLIVLLNYFLGGEITIAFIYKVLATIIVAGLSLLYYKINLEMYEKGLIKEKRKLTPKTGIKITSIILFISLIIFTFQIIGGPEEQRNKKLDSQRVQDLQIIEVKVLDYYLFNKSLPANLQEAYQDYNNIFIPKDGENKEYIYKILSDTSFELCATFNTELKNNYNLEPAKLYTNPELIKKSPQIIFKSDAWQHDKGEYCFIRELIIK